MSLEDSIAKYQQITGETVEVKPGYAVKIIDDNFMVWRLGVRDGTPYFWVDQMYGQMKHFEEFIREVCKAAGIDTIATATTRDPKAHIRKWKMTRVPECDYTHEGRFYFVLKGNISNLKG